MLTSGQAKYVNENVNSFIGLLFIASFALAMGLLIWHTAFGEDPVANFLTATVYPQGQ